MNFEHASQVELYTTPDGRASLEVRADGETVWLTRQQLSALFGRDVKTIGKHIRNARREELEGIPTVANFATVAREGDRRVERQVEHYNLVVKVHPLSDGNKRSAAALSSRFSVATESSEANPVRSSTTTRLQRSHCWSR